jgi:WD40 repeat protein
MPKRRVWVWAAALAMLFLVGLCMTVGVMALGIRSFSGSFANPFANADGEVVGEVRRIDLPGTAPEVTALAFLPDGKRALGKQGLDLCLWDLTTGKERSRVQVIRDVFHIAVSPDGRYALLSGSPLGLWDVDKAKELRTFSGDSATALFTPGGEQAWSLDQDAEAPVQGDGNVKVTFTGCTFHLWSVRDRRALRTFKGPSSGFWEAAFSQDCRRAVLWGSPERRLSGSPLQVWDLDKGQELVGLDGPVADLRAATISPDGQRLLTCAEDGKVCIWNLTTGRVSRCAESHRGRAQAVAFSPDGRRALTGGEDKTLRLWDVETGREVHRFEGHTGEIDRVLFSPDGTHALSSARDNTLRLWRLPETEGSDRHTNPATPASSATRLAIPPPIDFPPMTSPSRPSMLTTFSQASRRTGSLSGGFCLPVTRLAVM